MMFYFQYLISADLQAIQDIWLVGDAFLNDMFHTFTTMHREAQLRISEP